MQRAARTEKPALEQLSSLLYLRRRRPRERLGPAYDDTASKREVWAVARELSCLLSCVGGRQRQVGLGAEESRDSEVSLRCLPDSGVLSRLCPRKWLFMSPMCLQPSRFTRRCHQTRPQPCREAEQTITPFVGGESRFREAGPQAQPSVMRGLLHCVSANVSLPDSKTHVPSFPRFKVSKIGLCLTNDAKKKHSGHQARQQSDVIIPGSFCL